MSGIPNPYEAPKGSVGRESGAWRDGRLLVMTRGADLPKRCIVCNLPEVAHKRLAFFPWQGNVVRRIFKVVMPKAGLCRVHLEESRALTSWVLLRIGLVCGLCAVGHLALVVGVANPFAPIVGAAGLLANLTSMAMLLVYLGILLKIAAITCTPRDLSVYRTHGRFIWLAGVPAGFLEELPDWESR